MPVGACIGLFYQHKGIIIHQKPIIKKKICRGFNWDRKRKGTDCGTWFWIWQTYQPATTSALWKLSVGCLNQWHIQLHNMPLTTCLLCHGATILGVCYLARADSTCASALITMGRKNKKKQPTSNATHKDTYLTLESYAGYFSNFRAH